MVLSRGFHLNFLWFSSSNRLKSQFSTICSQGLILRSLQGYHKMYTARRKIQKDKGLEPTEFEDTVAQVILFPLNSLIGLFSI